MKVTLKIEPKQKVEKERVKKIQYLYTIRFYYYNLVVVAAAALVPYLFFSSFWVSHPWEKNEFEILFPLFVFLMQSFFGARIALKAN